MAVKQSRKQAEMQAWGAYWAPSEKRPISGRAAFG